MRLLKFIVISVLFTCTGMASGETPEEFRQRQQREMSDFRKMQLYKVQTFRDSVNSEYARFIADQWKQMNTMRHSRGFNPPPLMFASPNLQTKPVSQKTEHEPLQHAEPVPIVETSPVETNPINHEPQRTPTAPQGRTANFYGRTLTLLAEPLQMPQLRSASSRDVADYWRTLSHKADGILDELGRLEKELGLDDWGFYRLTHELAPYYIDGINNNERVIFSAYMLCQRGFKCKMARSGSKLYPLIVSTNDLFNLSYLQFNNDPVQYYLISNDRPTDVEVCTADFPATTRKLDITPPHELPSIGGSRASMTREWDNGFGSIYSCDIDYDPEIVRFLGSYPCIDFKMYIEGPIDKTSMNAIIKQLDAQMQNMDTKAKLNHLLHFVQYAFVYKTDRENYGYEKWNFPDETLVADYCDCEDRALLWCRLVRELTDVPIALVHYPGVHMAAAAAIESIPGDDTVNSGSRTYVICDPTYIGADAGMEMPPLYNSPRDIIPLF